MEGIRNEKTSQQKLEEFKISDIERMGDDKTYRSPFLHIEIGDLLPEAIETYSAFEREDFETAQGKLAELEEKIEKIKKAEQKISNEEFLHWIDNKIGEKLVARETMEDQEKDNY